MRGDDDRIELHLHRHSPEDGCNHYEYNSEEGRSEHVSAPIQPWLAPIPPGGYGERNNRQRQRRGPVTVRDLHQQVRRVRRRRKRAEAIRPVVPAAQAGSGDAHDCSEHYLRESKHKREIAESSHGSHISGAKLTASSWASALSVAFRNDPSSACESLSLRSSASLPPAEQQA